MTEKKRWRILRFLGYAIPVLLVAYVLSTGPVVILLDYSKYNSGLTYDEVLDDPKYQQYEERIGTFYTPLGLLMDSNESFAYVVDKYIELCLVIFPVKFKNPIGENLGIYD
jgi:hypothetical protein